MITVSTEADRIDVDRVHRWLSEETYWALGRSREVVERSMAHSLNVGAFEGEELVGYARVVTDHATFAWLCDVYVDRDHRGRGVGKALLERATEELAGLEVTRAVLATGDAHELYAAYGFGPLEDPSRWMWRTFAAT